MTEDRGHFVLEVPVKNDEDVILARQRVREVSEQMGFTVLDQTRLVTAVSELARNIVVHAKSGDVRVFKLSEGVRAGIKVVFVDQGPGIADVDQAMQEGFSSTGSLGIGLKGAKRLVDEFDLTSMPGKGTTVEITKWL